jgi:hypothetical protein
MCYVCVCHRCYQHIIILPSWLSKINKPDKNVGQVLPQSLSQLLLDLDVGTVTGSRWVTVKIINQHAADQGGDRRVFGPQAEAEMAPT